MIAVVLLLSVLVLMAVLAFTETGENSTNTLRSASAGQADAAATAGLSAAVYGIVNTTNSNFPCSVTSQNSGQEQYLLNPSQDPANEGNEQFSATITYYTSSWTPGAAPSSAVTGSGPGGCPTSADPTPGAAVITSTGTSKMANFTSSEVVQEQVQIEVASQSYVAYSGSGSALDLHNLQVQPPSSSTSNVGTIYTNGPVTNSGPCGKNGTGATIVAFGNSTLSNCGPIGGDIDVGNGNLTLSQSAVSGNVKVSGGYVVVTNGGNSAAQNVSASNNVYLCDQEPAASQLGPCSGSGLTYGAMTIGSATSAASTVSVGSDQPPTSSSSFGPYHGVTVGAVTNTSGFAVTPPSAYSLPALGSPSQTAWAANGYSTFESTSNCTGNATQAGSVLYYLANITSNTVINATCGTGGLNLSNDGNIFLGTNSGTKTNYNVALFVSGSGGITLGGSTQFQAPSAGNVELTLAETEPAGFSYSTSCTGGNYNVNDSDGNVAQTAVDMFIYTPCSFSFSGGGTINGEIIAGNLSLTKPLIMNYSAFTPPGLVFGYLAIVQQRQVVQL